MKKVAWALVGLLVGVLIATAIPVGAHHNDLRFRRRLNRLENQMAVQRQKTQYMDREGFYLALIDNYQVLSIDCLSGDDAVWVADPEFNVRILHCAEGAYQQQAQGMRAFLNQKE